MTTYYVGTAAAGDESGSSWANRLGTLNGAEDIPVSAGDTVYVGPGVYREMLTVDVAGSGGSPITYIGDVTGENTDGVGGIVRITGSDNDQTTARDHCIDNGSGDYDYRTFRGFALDTTASYIVDIGDADNWIMEDCTAVGHAGIYVNGDNQASIMIRRCVFFPKWATYGITFSSSTGIQDASHTVENCIFIGGRGVNIDDVGGIDFLNCLFQSEEYGMRVTDAPPGGYTANNVVNCIINGCSTGLRATAAGEIVEDYNTFFNTSTARTNVNTGGNSVTYPPLMTMPLLLDGYEFPHNFAAPSEWSEVRAITGACAPTEDMFGIARPPTSASAKQSWGPVQCADVLRETSTIRSGSASIKLGDAGTHQIFVPTTNEETTISAYVYRAASYDGSTCPSIVLKQPGQAASTVTDTGNAAAWNLLTQTWTPASPPAYTVIELVSYNTASCSGHEVYFDDLAVS